MASSSIRNEFSRLSTPRSLQDHYDSYTKVIDAGFKLLIDNQNNRPEAGYIGEGHMMYQMTLLKCLSIRKLFYEAIQYKNEIDPDTHFDQIWDPFAITPIVRSQFEAFGAFNHLYFDYNSEEEKELQHSLWVRAGLFTRQKFPVQIKAHKKKLDDERKKLDELEDKIENNPIIKSLPKDAYNIFKQKFGKGEWQFKVTTKKIEHLSFRQLAINAGCNPKFFGEIYSVMSLGSHPSNVSTFQFADLYKDGTHYWTTTWLVNMSEIITAFLIADFCRFSLGAKMSFLGLPKLSQALIDCFNEAFRDKTHVLNEESKKIFGELSGSIFLPG